MSVIINSKEIQTSAKSSSEKNEVDQKGIVQQYGASISMVFPIIICLVLEDSIKDSAFLRFITALLPCPYSGVHYFLLLDSNRNPHDESPSLFHPILYSILNLIFLLFPIISLLCIIAFTIYKWEEGTSISFSTIVSPMIVVSAYLLPTSCSLTPPTFDTQRLTVLM